MRVYVYYREIEGLTPTLYAYTNDPDLAVDFQSKRDRYIRHVYDMKRKKYNEICMKYPQLKLVYHQFQTVKNGKKTYAGVVATEKEIFDIELYGQEIVRREFNRSKIPARLFKEEYRDAVEYLLESELGPYLYFEDGTELGLEGMECPFDITDKYRLFKILYEKPMSWDN